MILSVAEIKAALQRGTLAAPHAGGDPAAETVIVRGFRTDSRAVRPGDLFVPLLAERDGHDFIEAARTNGAVAWLTSRPDDARPGAVLVDDTQRAFIDLAKSVQKRRPSVQTIGVTGSSGKTSTKDLVAGILRVHGPSGASEKSFNNEIGVPLTILNAPDEAWALVVEMGARGIGHIAVLCEIARPSIGIVTNVGTAHRGEYESDDGITIAKGELVASLPSSGTAVLNAIDVSFNVHRRLTDARVLSFGPVESRADLVATSIEIDAELRSSFVLNSPWGNVAVQLEARGEHQVMNALAAAGAALAAGASLAECAEGLATAELSPWRMEIAVGTSGAVVINDAYNANDQSMAAALRALAIRPGSRRIAVLGTMAELGDHAPSAHRLTVELARTLGVDRVIAVNEPLYVGADQHVATRESALQALSELGLRPGDVVLVKGSRMAGLEQLAATLLGATSGSTTSVLPHSTIGVQP